MANFWGTFFFFKTLRQGNNSLTLIEVLRPLRNKFHVNSLQERHLTKIKWTQKPTYYTGLSLTLISQLVIQANCQLVILKIQHDNVSLCPKKD